METFNSVQFKSTVNHNSWLKVLIHLLKDNNIDNDNICQRCFFKIIAFFKKKILFMTEIKWISEFRSLVIFDIPAFQNFLQ